MTDELRRQLDQAKSRPGFMERLQRRIREDKYNPRPPARQPLLVNDDGDPVRGRSDDRSLRATRRPPGAASVLRGMDRQVTPYYDEGGIQIWHGDCLELREWCLATVLVTDPPYGISYSTSMDHRKGTDRDRVRSVAGDSDSTLRDSVLAAWGDRPALIFGSWKVERPTGCRAVLTWCKGLNCGMGDLAMPWKPNTEEVYVLGNGFVGHRGSSVLNYQAPVSQVSWGRLHPMEKPVDLMRDLVGKCPYGVIADPFMGSGSTLRAAKDLGYPAVGVEIEERYCEIAAKRLAQEVLAL